MVSATECTDSASITELPLMKKPKNFAVAIPASAPNATVVAAIWERLVAIRLGLPCTRWREMTATALRMPCRSAIDSPRLAAPDNARPTAASYRPYEPNVSYGFRFG